MAIQAKYDTKGQNVKNEDLCSRYAMAFRLTFLPKGFDDETWQAAELMQQVLIGKGTAFMS